jgi:hypothetical protein
MELPTSKFSAIKATSLIFVLLLTSCTPEMTGREKRWNYSYYLFELPLENEGCSDCYIPLLVTEKLFASDSNQEAVVIITSERDSIWNFRQQLTKITGESIDEPSRKIRFEGKNYRCQRVPNDETVSLLQNPFGRIPIHRIFPPIPYQMEQIKEELLGSLSYD